MSFIDKYYAMFNNSVGQHSVTVSRIEFANLLGVFSKQEQQLDQLKAENEELKKALKEIKEIANHCINQDLCTFCNYNDKCYKGFEDEALSYDVCKLILEKISEVIDD